MIRLSIPDVPAFDAALGGGFKKALYGNLPNDDGVARGFGQSQVGAKLQDQWTRFRGETALSFETILELQASSAALAVLNIGHMEMVLVIETPLAALARDLRGRRLADRPRQDVSPRPHRRR